MKRFENILVGVDLSQGNHFVSDELPPASEEAIQRAMWLAKLNSAKLQFIYSLDVSAEAQRLINERQATETTVVDDAAKVLETIVDRATRQGIVADSLVVFGKSWLEIILQVLRGKHDLVVVGTRHLGSVESFLMGSTGMKLLRKCPCPVWVTQPQPERRIGSILVAHDLRAVGDQATELAGSMAQLQGAHLHVLHATEYRDFDYLLPARITADRGAEYREKAKTHIAAQLAEFDLREPAEVHIVDESPEAAILTHLQRHQIDLLVMGTLARAGIPGLFTGNTAERLLPQIPCSVIAVKPAGFMSPVTPY